jgi:Arc/MetJ family transcription regulator
MLRCMRTTVRLDEHLLAEAKKHAAESGKTLTAVLEQALRESLARRGVQARARPLRLKTFKGGGTRPGVDLDDSASLLDLMGS